ncbi:MAG: BamA/TamA family outer membrane protein, partial [Myxococcota bacterium]
SRNVRRRGQRIQPKVTLAADVFQFAELSQGIGNVRRESFFTDLADEFRRVDVLANVEVAYTVPRFLRETLNVEKLTLSIAPYYALDYLGVIIQGLQREEFGVRAELRKELFEVLDRLFVTVGVQGKNITTRDQESTDLTPDGFLLFEPRRVTGKFYLEGSIDRRDNPLNPREGWVLQVSPQLVSGSAQATGSSATQDPRGDVVGDAFTRLTATGSYYISLAKTLIFGQKFQYGHIVPIFGRAIPVQSDERYVLGGVSSVRGFPEGGLIARYDEFTQIRRGGEFIMNLNTELRLPLIASQGVWTGTFVDVGVLADCFSDLRDDETRVGCYADAFPSGARFSKVRASAGLGLRYLIAGQIPLLLDYAVVLNRRPGESFGNLHFNVGYSF